MFHATNIKKDSDKGKYEHSGYGIAFDELGSWSFGNDFAINVITFGVDNSSSFHTDNRKNHILVLGEGPTNGFNAILVEQRKSLVLISEKQRQSFA